MGRFAAGTEFWHPTGCAANLALGRLVPQQVVADRGYDHDKHRRLVRARGITPVIARRETEHGSRLGTVRWVVERTFAWLHHFKRLLVHYDRRHEIRLCGQSEPHYSPLRKPPILLARQTTPERGLSRAEGRQSSVMLRPGAGE
jgi:hypothetical protein